MNLEKRFIVTDAASSYTQAEANQKRISLIPLNLIFKNESFNDFTLNPSELYQKMENGSIPSTSSPNPQDFIDCYRSLRQQGATEILSVHLSSANSGTFQSALIASQESSQSDPGLKIKVVDTKALSIAQAFKVEAGQEMLNQGIELDEIEKELDKMGEKMVLYASTGAEASDFLSKSGRLKGFTALLATTLKVVPVVSLHQDGTIHPIEKTLSEKKGRIVAADLFKEEIKRRNQAPQRIGFAYTRDQKVAEELQSQVVKHLNELGIDPNTINIIGPKEAGSVLGAHTGPRTALVTALWK